MRAIESTVEIERPAAEVFAFVSDQLNAPRWQQGLESVKRLTPGPIRVGSEHEFVRQFGGRTVRDRNRFVEYVPGEYVRFTMGNGSISGEASYRVIPTGPARCRVEATLRFDKLGWMRPLAPILRRILVRDTHRDDLTLKRLLEGGQGATSGRDEPSGSSR
ncbi:SRPBCC family protein [Gulosibacter molinativorax]|uniref:SRPBCC family protein n=1 Tax=Gulosibacter molinativorax TaxID=256821 RepID=A0ABT7C3E9_9MICO|nr:SRPBCC family protein [Gulosibacter molinativorax]MDJ1369787.1 hypothetical protein [Gulosibacter molinativorax]QUY61752.1 Hypotetical protein [Gulosibacter molinativorax]